MGQWVGIESAAENPTPPPHAAASAAGAAASLGAGSDERTRLQPRLHRAPRLVLGSIDAAAHVLQRRARDVLLGSALFMVPVAGAGVWLSVLAFNDFDRLDGMFSDRGYLGVEAGATLLVVMLQSCTAHLVGAYAAHYLIQYQLGGEPTIRGSAVAVLRRLPLLLLTWALTHWWVLFLALAFLNASAADAVAVLFFLGPVAATIAACVLLVVPVVMGERLGVGSIRRGFRLARTRFGAVWGFVFANSLLGGLLVLFITLAPASAESTGLITFGRWSWLAQGIAGQLAFLVVTPVTALAAAQLYLQLRIHAEGMDIQMAAAQAFARA